MNAMQVPVSFEEVSVHFTEEEWSHLQDWQKELYKEVMQENLDSVLLLEVLCEPHTKAEDLAMTVDSAGLTWKSEEESQWDMIHWRTQCDRIKNPRGVLDKVHHRCSDCRKVVGSWTHLIDHKISHKRCKANTNHQEIKHHQGTCYSPCMGMKWSSSDLQPCSRWARSSHDDPLTYLERVDTRAGIKALMKYEESGNFGSTKTFGLLGNMVENGKHLLRCSSCPKIFTDVNLFIEHKKSHKENKGFTCPDCGKGFVRKSVLKLHRRTHTGERPFACSDCGKRFSQRFNLVIHQRIHSGEKPYKCPSCDRSFRYKPALMRHEEKCVKTIHRTRPGGKTKNSQLSTQTFVQSEVKTLVSKPPSLSNSVPSNVKPFAVTLTIGGQGVDTPILKRSASTPVKSSTTSGCSQLVPRLKSSSSHLSGPQSTNKQSFCKQSGTKPQSTAPFPSPNPTRGKPPSLSTTSISHKSVVKPLTFPPSCLQYSSLDKPLSSLSSSVSQELGPSSNEVVIHQSGIKSSSTTSSTHPSLKMKSQPKLSSELSPPLGGKPHLVSSSTNNRKSSLKSPSAMFPAMHRALSGKPSSVSFNQGFKSLTASLLPKYHPLYIKYHSLSSSSNGNIRGTRPLSSSSSTSCPLSGSTLLSSCKPLRSSSSSPSTSDCKTTFMKKPSFSSSSIYHTIFPKHSSSEGHGSIMKSSKSLLSPKYSYLTNSSSPCAVLHQKSVTTCPPPVQSNHHHPSSSKSHCQLSLSDVSSPRSSAVGPTSSLKLPLVLPPSICSSSSSKSPCDKTFPNFPVSIFKNSSSFPTLQSSSMANKSMAEEAKRPEIQEGGQTMQPVGSVYKCSQFTDFSQLAEHQNIHVETKNICPECNKSFHRKSTLILHKRTHTGEKPFSCMECGKSFSQRFNLVVHQRIHTGERPYICTECNKAFRYRTGLLRHQRHALCMRRRPAEDCPIIPPPEIKKSIRLIDTCYNVTASNVLSFSKHDASKVQEAPSEGTQNNIPLLPPPSTSKPQTLKAPEKAPMPPMKAPIKLLQDNKANGVCGGSSLLRPSSTSGSPCFPQPVNVVLLDPPSHAAKVQITAQTPKPTDRPKPNVSDGDSSDCNKASTDERPNAEKMQFKCEHCKRSFDKADKFVEHQITHSTARHVCTECGKAFSKTSQLVLHQRTHTGEKPYCCAKCSKQFSQKFNLVVHQRIHTGEKPYKCSNCDKDFRYRTSLVKHQKYLCS